MFLTNKFFLFECDSKETAKTEPPASCMPNCLYDMFIYDMLTFITYEFPMVIVSKFSHIL